MGKGFDMICDTRWLHDQIKEINETGGPLIFDDGSAAIVTEIKDKNKTETVRDVKLFDLTTLECNNDHCIVLRIKDNSEMALISLGCFNGDETMLRLTKGTNTTYTIFKKNGEHYSWSNGTLVSDSLRECAQMIRKCIADDYGINFLSTPKES